MDCSSLLLLVLLELLVLVLLLLLLHRCMVILCPDLCLCFRLRHGSVPDIDADLRPRSRCLRRDPLTAAF